MDKTISIIIPTYNMEAYLTKCLSSLVMDKGMERIEAIVVNDGSKDGSLAIAKDFAGRYPSTFRIIDKPNGNYGSCINAALKVATGKYVKILDADDSFDKDSFSEFVDVLDRTDVDLVLTNKVEIMSSGNRIGHLQYPEEKVFDFFQTSSMKNFKPITMHNITYRLEMVKAMKYTQTEGIFYTDIEWAFAPMAYVEKAFYLNRPLYNYLMTREGQSVSSDVADRHVKDEIIATIKNVNNYLNVRNRPQAVTDLLHKRLYRQIRRLYKRIIIKSPHLDGNVLTLLDEELRSKDREMYNIIGKETKYGLRYVNIWRKNKNSNVLKMIVKMFHYMG